MANCPATGSASAASVAELMSILPLACKVTAVVRMMKNATMLEPAIPIRVLNRMRACLVPQSKLSQKMTYWTARPTPCLKRHCSKASTNCPAAQLVMLKITLPEQADFYTELVKHPKVLKVVALSGGYSRLEGNTPEDDSFSFTKEPSIIEHKAYRDTWGRGLDSYLQWFYETAVLLHELLHQTGSLYVHLDWRVVHYAKVILDEVFSNDSFKAEVMWKKTTKTTSFKTFGSEHDTILVYTKNASDYTFNQAFTDLKESELLTKYVYLEKPDGKIITLSKEQRHGLQPIPPGRRFRGIPLLNMNPNRPNLRYEFLGHTRVWAAKREVLESAFREGRIFQIDGGLPQKKGYLDENLGAKVNDVWTDIAPINSQALEKLGYPTQKPEGLLARIIQVSSNEDDLVLDIFGGSGTTAAVAEKHKRRWITGDLGRFAIHTARKRLLSIEGVRPFVVQNLGKYERQLWATEEFGKTEESKKRRSASVLIPASSCSFTMQAACTAIPGCTEPKAGAWFT